MLNRTVLQKSPNDTVRSSGRAKNFLPSLPPARRPPPVSFLYRSPFDPSSKLPPVPTPGEQRLSRASIAGSAPSHHGWKSSRHQGQERSFRFSLHWIRSLPQAKAPRVLSVDVN